MSSLEELMPSVGTSVPSPSVLTVLLCHSDSALQDISRNCSDESSSFLAEEFDNPFDFCDESIVLSKTNLISISDDGKIWSWLLTAEGNTDAQKIDKTLGLVNGDNEVSFPEAKANTDLSSKQDNVIIKVSSHLEI